MRDGILKHSKGYGKVLPDDPEELACTYEGRVVRVADFMAYLNHDLDDAVRSGVMQEEQVPESCSRLLGKTHSERAATMIKDLISSSRAEDGVFRLRPGDEVRAAMLELRQFMFENVYRSHRVQQDFEKSKKILTELYAYLPAETRTCCAEGLADLQMGGGNHTASPRERLVCDFVAQHDRPLRHEPLRQPVLPRRPSPRRSTDGPCPDRASFLERLRQLFAAMDAAYAQRGGRGYGFVCRGLRGELLPHAVFHHHTSASSTSAPARGLRSAASRGGREEVRNARAAVADAQARIRPSGSAARYGPCAR
ncbi:MAG: hypothetical protein MZV70_06940 [Desulfobacterales bacterium]|nr:hypothetical protein [Desulfobacterales bacterium]